MEWFSLYLMVGVALAAERGGDEPIVEEVRDSDGTPGESGSPPPFSGGDLPDPSQGNGTDLFQPGPEDVLLQLDTGTVFIYDNGGLDLGYVVTRIDVEAKNGMGLGAGAEGTEMWVYYSGVDTLADPRDLNMTFETGDADPFYVPGATFVCEEIKYRGNVNANKADSKIKALGSAVTWTTFDVVYVPEGTVKGSILRVHNAGGDVVMFYALDNDYVAPENNEDSLRFEQVASYQDFDSWIDDHPDTFVGHSVFGPPTPMTATSTCWP